MENDTLLLILILILVSIVVAFFGGRQYQKNKHIKEKGKSAAALIYSNDQNPHLGLDGMNE